jgi:hypothetical protein
MTLMAYNLIENQLTKQLTILKIHPKESKLSIIIFLGNMYFCNLNSI